MMFDESAYYTGRPLGAQGQFPAAPILKHIHFFLDDVGGFAQRTLEQIQRLEGRRANFMKSELFKQQAGPRLQFLKLRSVRRQDIMRSANRLKVRHDGGLYE